MDVNDKSWVPEEKLEQFKTRVHNHEEKCNEMNKILENFSKRLEKDDQGGCDLIDACGKLRTAISDIVKWTRKVLIEPSERERLEVMHTLQWSKFGQYANALKDFHTGYKKKYGTELTALMKWSAGISEGIKKVSSEHLWGKELLAAYEHMLETLFDWLEHGMEETGQALSKVGLEVTGEGSGEGFSKTRMVDVPGESSKPEYGPEVVGEELSMASAADEEADSSRMGTSSKRLGKARMDVADEEPKEAESGMEAAGGNAGRAELPSDTYKERPKGKGDETRQPLSLGTPTRSQFESRYRRMKSYESACDAMSEELSDFAAHLLSVGGDKKVIDASEKLDKALKSIVALTWSIIESETLDTTRGALKTFYGEFTGQYSSVLSEFRESLYGQRHAFYFSEVNKWEKFLKECKFPDLCAFLTKEEPPPDNAVLNHLENILETVPKRLEAIMKAVGEELRTFRKKALPTFLSDEKERTATRYINITTIATFFSSVTAIMLQFSLTCSDEKLGSIVNLFWFISIVFSISSGITSLLGLTWRKSPIYYSRPAPSFIKIWLDEAPLVFLVIAALLFMIGMNVFVYMPCQSQVRYVSFSTNAFTAVHSFFLVFVTCWVTYQLQYESSLAKGIRAGRDFILGNPIFVLIDRVKDTNQRRNIYWALGFDTRVLQLNRETASQDNIGPFSAARCIRWLTYPPRMGVEGCRMAKKVLAGCIRRHQQRDEEEGQGEAALDDYRKILEKTFNNKERIEIIIWHVNVWIDGDWNDDQLKVILRKHLWGYPKLVAAAFNSRLTYSRHQKIEERRRKEAESEKQRRDKEESNCARNASPALLSATSDLESADASQPFDTTVRSVGTSWGDREMKEFISREVDTPVIDDSENAPAVS